MQVGVGPALQALRERWWILLLAAVLAGATAYAYTKLPWVEERWRSSVLLQASGRLDYGVGMAVERQLRPLAEQVRQLEIMREVNRTLHLDLPVEKMLENTRAEPLQDSFQIRIDVEDTVGQRAERTVLEVAEVFARRHNADQGGKPTGEQVFLSALDRRVDATLIWPQTRLLVAAAAGLGLLAAAGAILALAYLDDTFKTRRAVEEELGLAVIGVVPRFKVPDSTEDTLARQQAAPRPAPSRFPASPRPGRVADEPVGSASASARRPPAG